MQITPSKKTLSQQFQICHYWTNAKYFQDKLHLLSSLHMPYFTKIQSPATKFSSSDFSLSSFSLTYSSKMSESSESSTGGLISTIEVSPSSTSSEPLNQSVPASLFWYHLCGIFFGELVLFHRQAFKRVRCQTSYKSSEYNPIKYSLLEKWIVGCVCNLEPRGIEYHSDISSHIGSTHFPKYLYL